MYPLVRLEVGALGVGLAAPRETTEVDAAFLQLRVVLAVVLDRGTPGVGPLGLAHPRPVGAGGDGHGGRQRHGERGGGAAEHGAGDVPLGEGGLAHHGGVRRRGSPAHDEVPAVGAGRLRVGRRRGQEGHHVTRALRGAARAAGGRGRGELLLERLGGGGGGGGGDQPGGGGGGGGGGEGEGVAGHDETPTVLSPGEDGLGVLACGLVTQLHGLALHLGRGQARPGQAAHGRHAGQRGDGGHGHGRHGGGGRHAGHGRHGGAGHGVGHDVGQEADAVRDVLPHVPSQSLHQLPSRQVTHRGRHVEHVHVLVLGRLLLDPAGSGGRGLAAASLGAPVQAEVVLHVGRALPPAVRVEQRLLLQHAQRVHVTAASVSGGSGRGGRGGEGEEVVGHLYGPGGGRWAVGGMVGGGGLREVGVVVAVEDVLHDGGALPPCLAGLLASPALV